MGPVINFNNQLGSGRDEVRNIEPARFKTTPRGIGQTIRRLAAQ